MRPIYPWAAIVGQSDAKLALTLCAIDPAIGGVLIHGPRGVAKTTLARALGELVSGPFVELPLGASEERVTGTLDLDVALRGGGVRFAPGLLARAHQGVLYVDEVNLLPDPIVDLLLDAAASGQNVVERDGVSHAHPSRFVLAGSMNPEEGELRPQLLDRFGLCVSAQAEPSPIERMEIVARRLAFERDPDAFRAAYAPMQQEWCERIRAAREVVGRMPLDPATSERVAARCSEARVDGVRADLAMLRAARAHAAWWGREQAAIEDLEAVAELALAHRRRDESPFDPEPPPHMTRSRGQASTWRAPNSLPAAPDAELPPRSAHSDGMTAEPGSTARTSRVPRNDARAAPQSEHTSAEAAAEAAPKTERWHTGSDAREHSAPAGPRCDAAANGIMVPIANRRYTAPLTSSLRREPSRRTAQRGSRRNEGFARPGRAPRGAIDWFATLARSARPSRADLRFRPRCRAERELVVVLLDCSGSMLRGGALAEAKAVARALAREARERGAELALVSFRDTAARVESAPRARPAAWSRRLRSLHAGGGTPLRRAIEAALTLASDTRSCSPRSRVRMIVLSDGRCRDAVADLAAPLHRRGVETLVVDCERGFVRLGRCAELARALETAHLHLDALALRLPSSRMHPRRAASPANVTSTSRTG